MLGNIGGNGHLSNAEGDRNVSHPLEDQLFKFFIWIQFEIHIRQGIFGMWHQGSHGKGYFINWVGGFFLWPNLSLGLLCEAMVVLRLDYHFLDGRCGTIVFLFFCQFIG